MFSLARSSLRCAHWAGLSRPRLASGAVVQNRTQPRCYNVSRDPSKLEVSEEPASTDPTNLSSSVKDARSNQTGQATTQVDSVNPSRTVEFKTTTKIKTITDLPISNLLDVYPSESDPSRMRVRGIEIDVPLTAKGRVVGVRRHGSKLLFLDIVGDYEKLQVMVNFKTLQKRSPAEWADATADDFREKADRLQRGDWVVVAGHMENSKRGILRMCAHNLPSIRAKPAAVPPESVTDDELKGRARHLDLMLNQQSVDALRARARIVQTVRRALDDRGYVEVQTPLLAGSAGGAAARPFATTATEFGPSQRLALRVAPELWLKRLIMGGMDRVYEVGPCFRNESVDVTHNPEFTMCEFYEAWANLDHLIVMTERLMKLIISDLNAATLDAQAVGRRAWKLPDANLIADKFWDEGTTPKVNFISRLEEALGFKLPDLESDTALAELITKLRERGEDADVLAADDSEQREATATAPVTLPKLLDNLGSKYVENGAAAATGRAFFVTHHPACMAPLARSGVCPITGQKVALRAEFFVDGVELANMYEEEFEADEQERKFRAAARSRSALVELDDNEASYVEAMRAGMPPTGGWGCGVDRLAMLFTGAPRIRDVLTFGNLRNVLHATRSPARVKADVTSGAASDAAIEEVVSQ
ncbi:hypothetical protein PspLS_04182 [Pyricularia sp. CBS 133598]|nr:hypothetical protein PspLS_04182 [Pyricularia sp. CBS 133598]